MKSRKRISRKIIITGGVVAVFFALYLTVGLLPGRSKDYATRKIEELTNKKVLFTKILYLPFEGLSLQNVKVMDKRGSLIFSAKKLAINARLIPFFTNKRIIITNLYLESPVYEFQINPRQTVAAKPPIKTQISGQIDVPTVSDRQRMDLHTIQQEGPEALLPENLTLEQIEILNGTVTVRQDASSPVIEEIRSIHIRMGFQKPPKLSFNGSVRLGHSPYAMIRLKGSWDLEKADYEFYLDTQSDFIPPWLLDYQKRHFLILKNSRLKLSAHLKSTNETLALFHSQAWLDDSQIIAGSGVYTGRMNLDVQGVFDFETRRFDRYRGTLELDKVDVSNLTEKIDSLKNVSGRIRFQPDRLEFVDVKGEYKNVPFQTDGALQSFVELNLEETIRVESDVKDMLALVPEDQKKMIKDFSLEGHCQAVTTVKGSLKPPNNLKIDYQLRLEDGRLTNPTKQIHAAQVQADIFANEAGITIKNARFNLAQKAYRLDAFISKKPETPGTLELSSDDLKLGASYFLSGDNLTIPDAHLETRGITADLHGKAYGLQNPYVDVTGRLEIQLDKTAQGFAKEAPFLKTSGLSGTLKGLFTLKGLWKNPLDWELKIDAASPVIFIHKKIQLTAVEVQARMKDQRLKLPFLHAKGYEGDISGEAAIDLSKPSPSFEAKVYANEVDLHALVEELDASKKDIAGKMIFQLSLKGAFNSPQSLAGNGLVSIHDSRLFKTDLFKPMGRLPFVKVEGLELVEFTSLNASFVLRDKRVWTQNLWLLSETVDLSLEGSIGFDQSLDLIMDIRYSDNVIRGAYDSGGLVPFVVQQAENSLSQYKVSGTLKEPKYSKISGPPVSTVGSASE